MSRDRTSGSGWYGERVCSPWTDLSCRSIDSPSRCPWTAYRFSKCCRVRGSSIDSSRAFGSLHSRALSGPDARADRAPCMDDERLATRQGPHLVGMDHVLVPGTLTAEARVEQNVRLLG